MSAYESVEQFIVLGDVYRLQGRTCSSPENSEKHCKCHEGQLHGPYWFRFEGGGGAAKYVGKQLPEWIMEHLQELKKAKAKIREMRQAAEARSRELSRAFEKEQELIRTLSRLEHGDYVDASTLQAIGFGMLARPNVEEIKKRTNGHKNGRKHG